MSYEYEKIFQGDRASGNQIRKEDINLMIAVNTLIEGGTVVGQATLEGDVEYFLNPEQQVRHFEIISNWMDPQTKHEKEHLARTEIPKGASPNRIV